MSRQGPAREAILEAAITEFAAHGLDGVRLEHVARRAGCNKALVYRYFTDRQGLFEAALTHAVERREAILREQPTDLGEALAHWFRANDEPSEREFLRLLARESLNDEGGPLAHEAPRRDYYARQVAGLRGMQAAGVAPELDSKALFLALLALTVYPRAYPSICRLVTGQDPRSPGFTRRWTQLLRGLAVRLEAELHD